jgi:chemotaxis signal transduction protein
VLVVEREGAKHGLLVDGVKEILELEDASILSGGPPLSNLKAELVAGVAKVRESLVIILEDARLLEGEAPARGPAGRGPAAEEAEEAEEVGG